MTPTQLRSFATVVRTGSVRAAASELDVSEAAVSGNVGALRKELGDKLFSPSRTGLVFTPGGLRLAHRATEILGLQEQTRREVGSAHRGRRLLRVAATSLFAEYSAPALIELFSSRADDLDVELLVESTTRFPELLHSHAADVAIGPKPSRTSSDFQISEFLRYDIVAVATREVVDANKQTPWLLGPSAVEPAGVSQFILQRADVSEDRQRIYPSHAAAAEEARNGHGIALVPAFAVTRALSQGLLVKLDDPRLTATGTWIAQSLSGDRSSAVARELCRFITTPRAIQAMRSGSGSGVRRYKPRVHVTLWS